MSMKDKKDNARVNALDDRTNWPLFLAIVMMVASALISYFLVRENDAEVASLKMTVQDKQMLMRDLWNNIGKEEGKADMAILVSVLAQKDTPDTTKLRAYYLSGFSQLNPAATLVEILRAVERERKLSLARINALYLETTTMQNKIAHMEQANRFYGSFAFFLQLIGLIVIILNKDLPES